VTAPLSGEVLEPTEANLSRESVRAGDAEDAQVWTRGRGAFPGAVGATLRAVLGRGDLLL
jgi:hypothetical protein